MFTELGTAHIRSATDIEYGHGVVDPTLHLTHLLTSHAKSCTFLLGFISKGYLAGVVPLEPVTRRNGSVFHVKHANQLPCPQNKVSHAQGTSNSGVSVDLEGKVG
jgi:hypothetical protein